MTHSSVLSHIPLRINVCMQTCGPVHTDVAGLDKLPSSVVIDSLGGHHEDDPPSVAWSPHALPRHRDHSVRAHMNRPTTMQAEDATRTSCGRHDRADSNSPEPLSVCKSSGHGSKPHTDACVHTSFHDRMHTCRRARARTHTHAHTHAQDVLIPARSAISA